MIRLPVKGRLAELSLLKGVMAHIQKVGVILTLYGS